jgi:hypothetical protein
VYTAPSRPGPGDSCTPAAGPGNRFHSKFLLLETLAALLGKVSALYTMPAAGNRDDPTMPVARPWGHRQPEDSRESRAASLENRNPGPGNRHLYRKTRQHLDRDCRKNVCAAQAFFLPRHRQPDRSPLVSGSHGPQAASGASPLHPYPARPTMNPYEEA